MKEIQDYITNAEFGEIQKYRNVAIIPIITPVFRKADLDYLVFDEAVKSGLEISETGSVPFLHFENNTGKEILIMQGEYVKGGKQDRMVSTNIYLARDFNGQVPVNCVQHGRWTSGGERVAFASACKRATSAVRSAALVDQSAVWDEVAFLGESLETRSSTQNIREIYEKKQENTSQYLKNFQYAEGSSGVVVVINKKEQRLYSVDLFDQSKTLDKNFKKIIESYAIEALAGGSDIQISAKESTEFVNKITESAFSERKAVSLGRDFAIMGESLSGTALVYEYIPLYTSYHNISGRNKERENRRLTGLRMPRVGRIRTYDIIYESEDDLEIPGLEPAQRDIVKLEQEDNSSNPFEKLE